MRLVLASFVALCLASTAARATVVDVLSGDLIRVGDKLWHVANIEASIELTCAAEVKLGLAARAKLAELVSHGEMEIRPLRYYDMNHRQRAYIRVDGADVGEAMLAAKLAIPWGSRHPRCLASIPVPPPVFAAPKRPPSARTRYEQFPTQYPSHKPMGMPSTGRR